MGLQLGLDICHETINERKLAGEKGCPSLSFQQPLTYTKTKCGG